MLSKNPTRTLTIERNWNREITRRFTEFGKVAIDSLTEANKRALLTNQEIGLNPSQLRAYMAFLEQEIQRILLGTDQPPNWQAEYQLQAYMRGLDQTRKALIAQGASLALTAEELAIAQGLSAFTAVPTLGTVATMAPIHQDALEFLFTRSYESLKGWTDKMARDVRQILFDAVSQGQGIAETSKQIRERVNVTSSRARLIAQTETIQAFQVSTANETERASEELDEEVLIRWLTRLDNRVRHLHAENHGRLFTPKQYRVKINESPFNCRCGSAPVIPEANTPTKQEKFDEQREAMIRLERR